MAVVRSCNHRWRSGTLPRTCWQSLLFVISELELTASCKVHVYWPVGWGEEDYSGTCMIVLGLDQTDINYMQMASRHPF